MKMNYRLYFFRFIICVIILLYIANQIKSLVSEGFNDRPDNNEKNKRINMILDNKQLFDMPFYTVRKKLPWINAVIYEDVRYLQRGDNFTPDNLGKLFD